MKQYEEFNYDGIDSSRMNVVQARLNGDGFLEENFLSSREILEEKVRGNETPYFFGVEAQPYEFQLEIYFNNEDGQSFNELSRWFNQDYYKPLYFKEKPSRIFYCMAIGDSTYTHNGMNEGVITFTMRCDSPYSYSPVSNSETYDFSNSSSIQEIIFENKGDIVCKPIVYIEKIEDGSITIKNLSNSGVEFTFDNLLDGENLTVDCEGKDIETDLINTYRYGDFNENYLEFVYGVNRLQIVGKCKLKFEYYFSFTQDY